MIPRGDRRAPPSTLPDQGDQALHATYLPHHKVVLFFHLRPNSKARTSKTCALCDQNHKAGDLWAVWRLKQFRGSQFPGVLRPIAIIDEGTGSNTPAGGLGTCHRIGGRRLPMGHEAGCAPAPCCPR